MRKNAVMRLLILAFAAAGAVVTNCAAASILLNGSFESPTVPVNSYQFVTPNSWVGGSSTVALFNGSVEISPGSYWPSPENGQQYVDIGDVSTYSLSQGFTLTGGGAYQLAWYDNAYDTGTGTTSPYSVTISNNSFQVVAAENLNAAPAAWQGRALLLNLGPGTYTLTFTALGIPYGYDTLLDNVTLTPVPTPPAMLLLATGIAGLVSTRIRGRKQ